MGSNPYRFWSHVYRFNFMGYVLVRTIVKPISLLSFWPYIYMIEWQLGDVQIKWNFNCHFFCGSSNIGLYEIKKGF